MKLVASDAMMVDLTGTAIVKTAIQTGSPVAPKGVSVTRPAVLVNYHGSTFPLCIGDEARCDYLYDAVRAFMCNPELWLLELDAVERAFAELQKARQEETQCKQ